MKVIANKIDHTNLKPYASVQDITKLCEEANEHGFATVCVAPTYVSLAQKLTEGEVGVCTVIGFPFGYDETITKIAAIQKAVDNGADELDVVVNISKIKSGDWAYIENELDQLLTITQHKAGKVLKLIFEISYLTNDELTKLCEICNKFTLDFTKTSTGFSESGANLDTVKKMRSLLNDKVKIKASGGISTLDEAEAFIAAGAERLGCSKSVSLVSNSNR